ncbi:MAG TPA: hypothetical protein VEL03_23410 [Streptosporangiaceae bacterium]|nr:hypothetical protein [Streptosporangiaceae bacterium]
MLGRTAVSDGGDDGTVRVWDLAGTARPQMLTGHDSAVYAVAVSADGRTAVSGGGRDRTVRMWDLAGNREQARWMADAGILAVAVNSVITLAGDTAGQVHALQLKVPVAASA